MSGPNCVWMRRLESAFFVFRWGIGRSTRALGVGALDLGVTDPRADLVPHVYEVQHTRVRGLLQGLQSPDQAVLAHVALTSSSTPWSLGLAKEFLHDYLFVTVGVVGAACSDVSQQVWALFLSASLALPLYHCRSLAISCLVRLPMVPFALPPFFSPSLLLIRTQNVTS